MSQLKTDLAQSSNFDLKKNYVDLSSSSAGSAYSLKDLEAHRANAAGLSASKHGLELICGASCETGAQ